MIPFVKYRNYTENNIDVKILDNIYISDMAKFRQWSESKPHGIQFRIRMSVNKKDLDYENYAICTIFGDGKIEVKCMWKEIYNANFENISKIMEILIDFIKDINKYGKKYSRKIEI